MFGCTSHIKLKRERKIRLVCKVSEDELCMFGGRDHKKVASVNPLSEGSCFLRAPPSELMTKNHHSRKPICYMNQPICDQVMRGLFWGVCGKGRIWFGAGAR